MAKVRKKPPASDDHGAIWIIRGAADLFDQAAITVEELSRLSSVSRGTVGKKIVKGEPATRIKVQKVFRILNAQTGNKRDESTSVVRKGTA